MSESEDQRPEDMVDGCPKEDIDGKNGEEDQSNDSDLNICDDSEDEYCNKEFDDSRSSPMVISDADRETFRNAFSLFDVNGDGVISKGELGTLLRALGQNPTQDQVEELLEVINTSSITKEISGIK